MSEDIINARKLMMKCSNIADDVSERYIVKAVMSGLLPVQSAAKLLAPVHDGELRGSIRKRANKTPNGAIGEVYTNKEYASYVEFGTGPSGAENHSGISPFVSPVYTLSPWWIHESQIDPDTAERYHWFYLDTPDGRFYQCTGQAAQPYMYPALKDNEDEALKRISLYLARKIKEEASK